MPVIVAGALTYLWPGIVAAIGTAGVTALSYAIVVGAFYAYGAHQARRARSDARDAFNASLQDRLVMTATTNAPRSRLYGRIRNVDGILFKNTHGSLSQFYTFVVGIGGHEVDGFEDYWLADLKVTLDGSGYVQDQPYNVLSSASESVTITPVSSAGSTVLPHVPLAGTIHGLQPAAVADDPANFLAISFVGTTASYTTAIPGQPLYIVYQFSQGSSKARIRGYTGAPGQDLSTELIALGVPDVTSAHKFQGIACLLVTLEFNTDAFPQGVPAMSATVRGAKVLDPRTSTTAWSENPALCAYDWARYAYGGNAAVDEIVTDSVITAANACDVVNTFTLSDASTVVAATYTCGVVAPTKSDPTEVLNELVSAMAGKYAWTGGLLRFKAGAYAAPVDTIDESWLSGVGQIEIVSGIQRQDLVNIYRPTIADKGQGYIVTPAEELRADSYVTLDGEELPREVTFLGITDTYHAQHVSGVLLRDARQGLTVKLPCNFRAYPLEVFDTVAITLDWFGWVAKEFEILTWEYAATGGIVITAKETAGAIFDLDLEFPLSDIAPNTALPLPWVVPEITGLAATSGAIALEDGSVITRTLVTWDPTTSEYVAQSGTIEIQCASVWDMIWQSVYTEGRDTQVIISALLGNTPYVFRARAISSSPLNVKSNWCDQIVELIAAPAAVIADWTDVPGRPIIYRAIAKGHDDVSAPLVAGLYDETGALVQASSRSYMLSIFDRTTGLALSAIAYDVYSGGGQPAALAAALNALGNDRIVCISTYDEPQANRLTGGLYEAMVRCGASPAIFGKATFAAKSAYVLVGIPGCGSGNGYEAYCDYSTPTVVFCDVSFMLKGGNFIVSGSSAKPGQLLDYGYSGTLDATTDLSLIARGNCVLAGNLATKLGGSTTWDSDVYSRDSAYGACMASAVAGDTSLHVMFGLNSDPTTDQTYTSLDYAWYMASGAVLAIYESGVAVAFVGSYAAGDVLTIVYDGSNVRYLHNAVLLRTVAATPGLVMFFDSSFYDPSSALRNIRFGALSANDWASIGNVSVATPQIAANAATEVHSDDFDFAGATYGLSAGFSIKRTVTYTPPVNCTVEFTATIGARNIHDDSAMNIRWSYKPAAGVLTPLGYSSGENSGRTQQSCVASFVATGGVALDFYVEVRNSIGSPQFVTLYLSNMRVTFIKR